MCDVLWSCQSSGQYFLPCLSQRAPLRTVCRGPQSTQEQGLRSPSCWLLFLLVLLAFCKSSFFPKHSTLFESDGHLCSFLRKEILLPPFLGLVPGSEGFDNTLVGTIKRTSKKEALPAVSRCQPPSRRPANLVTVTCTLSVIFNKPLPTRTFYFPRSPYNHVLFNRNCF